MWFSKDATQERLEKLEISVQALQLVAKQHNDEIAELRDRLSSAHVRIDRVDRALTEHVVVGAHSKQKGKKS
jgi:predicted  nucleic acid-binding Zn-ribbon protein